MILLDTNVLSALMQYKPDAQVVAWLDAQLAESIWISSVTVFEARYGLAILPEGRRRVELQERFDSLLAEDLQNRVWPFDAPAATEAAKLAARRKAIGRPVDLRDTFIAGIAISHGATVASRNVRHFADLTIPVVNPWVEGC